MNINKQPTPDEIVNLLKAGGSPEHINLAERIERLGVDGLQYKGADNTLKALTKQYDNHPRLEEVRQRHMANGNCSMSSIYIDFIDELLEYANNDDIVRKWISVAEELPEIDTPVLVCVKGLDYPIVAEMRMETCNPMIEPFFKDYKYWVEIYNESPDVDDKIYAWMPLYRILKLNGE